MDGGTILWILLIGGGLVAMFFMHRGGHAHGGLAGGSRGHDHAGPSPGERHEEREPRTRRREPSEEDEQPLADGPRAHEDHEPAARHGKHRGC